MNDFISKYKPKKIECMLLNPTIKVFCSIFIEQIKNNHTLFSHLLFDGLSGIGKTSIALLLVKEIGFPFKEFNASDIRGINIIDDIIIFYKLNSMKHISVILDESDNLTLRGQELIIQLMDNYPNIHIFFTTNKKKDLISEIHKRVFCINMQYFDLEDYFKYFIDICKHEKLKISKIHMENIIQKNNYDIRKILNELDSTKWRKKNVIYNPKEIFDYVQQMIMNMEYSNNFVIEKLISDNIIYNINFHDFLEYFLHNTSNPLLFDITADTLLLCQNNYTYIDFLNYILCLRKSINRK